LKTIRVTFGEHVAQDRIAGMTSQLGAFGVLDIGPGKRDVTVNLVRDFKAASLTSQLIAWERWGFLTWTERQDPN
jgi:hypothetical protein